MGDEMEMTDREKAVFEHQSKLMVSMHEGAARVQSDVIRMLFLINGGALVALLALMGALAKTGAIFPDALGEIVALFSRGLVATVVGAFFAWMFQDMQASVGHVLLIEWRHEPRPTLRGNWGRGFAATGLVIAIAVSLWCCVSAMNKSALALSALAKSIPPATAATKP